MRMQTYVLKFLLYFFFNDTGINCTTHSANSGMIIKTLPQHSNLPLNSVDVRTREPQRGRVPPCGSFTVHRHLDLNAM